MSDVLEAALQEVRDFNNGVEAPEAPAPVSAEPVVEAPPEKPRFASLDEVIIDDPRLPESLRGQPASVLFEDRTKGWHEAHQKGFQTNRLEAERDAAIALLEKLAAKLNEKAPEPTPATPTRIDRLRTHGVEPIDILSDANKTLDATILAAADESESRFAPKIEAYEKRLAEIEKERADERTARQHEKYRSAFLAARPENVPLGIWENDYSGQISSYLILKNLPLDDVKSYKEAAGWVEDFIQRRTGSSQPAPVQAAPAAPAPPVGGGKPAPVQPSKRAAHLNNHDREAYAKVTDIFKRFAPKVDTESILEELHTDPKTRGLFP
jgi:hypothetical protein